MNCLIDKTIQDYARKGKSIEAIRKHIRKNYNINIDPVSIRERVKKLKLYLKPNHSL